MRGSGVVFVCVLWSIGFVVGDTSECGLPEGVEVPEEIIIGGLAVSEGPVITSITSTALRVAVDLVNRDKCLLPGVLTFSFSLFLFSLFFTLGP